MSTSMIVAVSVIAFLGTLYIVARVKMKNIPVVADNDMILTLTDKNFQHQTKNRLVLVDFWASWCAPCRMMAPVLNEVVRIERVIPCGESQYRAISVPRAKISGQEYPDSYTVKER